MKYFSTKRVTIVSEDEPSTSAGTSFSVYAIPEELLDSVVGSWNRWRILVIGIFCVFMIFNGLNLFASELFTPLQLGFNCTEGTIRSNSCFTVNGSRCHTFEFSQHYGYTLTEKWNLVCDKRIPDELSNVLFQFGIALGYVITGRYADRWGRKKVLFICLVLQPCTGILETASKSYIFFSILRFFNGFSLSGTALVAIVLTCEISSNKWRTFDLGLLCLSFAMGHVLLPYIWMIFADSMKNILVMSIPQILLMAFIGVIKESPNLLLLKNQTSTAESVLLAVARFNGQKLPSNFRLRPVQIINVSNRRSLGFFNMLKPSSMRWVSVAVCLTWFLTTFINGIMVAQLFKENDNILKMILLCGISSIVAAVVCLILCHIIKHRLVIAVSSILGGITISVSHYVIGPVEHNKDIFVLIHLAAYGLHTLALFTIWNMTPRVFPTEIRGEGTGVAFAVGELSFTFARLLLPSFYNRLPVFLAILWCSIAVVLICCIVLFSVHNRELPDIIEDAVNFRNTYKPTRWSTLRGTSPTLDETEVKIVDFERGTSLTVGQSNIPRFGNFRKTRAQDPDIAAHSL